MINNVTIFSIIEDNKVIFVDYTRNYRGRIENIKRLGIPELGTKQWKKLKYNIIENIDFDTCTKRLEELRLFYKLNIINNIQENKIKESEASSDVKVIGIYDEENGLIDSCTTVEHASELTGVSQSLINKILSGERKSSKGFYFKYI